MISNSLASSYDGKSSTIYKFAKLYYAQFDLACSYLEKAFKKMNK